MKVTGKFLKQQGACGSQRRKFKRMFGDSATVNMKNIKRAAKSALSVWWLQDAGFLSPKQSKRFQKMDGVFAKRIEKMRDPITGAYPDIDWSMISWAAFAVAVGVAELKRGSKLIGFEAIE